MSVGVWLLAAYAPAARRRDRDLTGIAPPGRAAGSAAGLGPGSRPTPPC